MSAPVIALHGLTKHYGPLVAVSGLTLEVRAGEVFGFLGLNGAGKTTTIRVLLDLLRPTAGRASIFGRDCQAEGLAVRAGIGYQPGEFGFYHDMTGEQTLGLLARLSGRGVEPAYRRRLVDRFELGAADLRRRLREYSTGMKRKLSIIQAFQADPPLLILDEPTEGLDPLMQEAFYDLVAEVRRRGRTVFLSSHVLSEVERVCDRVAVLRSGRLALLSAVDEIRKLAPRRITISFDADVRAAEAVLPAGVTVVEFQSRRWTLHANGAIGPLVRALAGLPVNDIDVREPKLEDILIRYYRDAP